MAKMKIRTMAPWMVPKSRTKSQDVAKGSAALSRNKTGGGDNPTRSQKNRNKSGSHLDPTLKGGTPDRFKKRGDYLTPDIAKTPSRVVRGSAKTPQIKTSEPSKRAFKQGG